MVERVFPDEAPGLSPINRGRKNGNRSIRPATHLLVLPVPFFRDQGNLYLELQALDGLQRWLANFDTMIVAAQVADRTFLERNPAIAWVSGESLRSRVQFVQLPMAYKVREFTRHFRDNRALLAECIDKAKFLQFGIGALVGDWAGVAAEIAIRKRRKFAVHMDRVEHDVIIRTNRSRSLLHRTKARTCAMMMRRWHHRLIAHSSLSLCNGRECFDAFKGLNSASFLINDLHIEANHKLAVELKNRKNRELSFGLPLKLCYAGRLDVEKAPLDWVRALAHAKNLGVRFEATWLGDGPLRKKATALAEQMGLGSCVSFPGFVENRDQVMKEVGASHAMVFTHVTPESPRCLIEALMHATPIIGYDTKYSQDLIAEGDGGLHVPSGDYLALGGLLFELDQKRERFTQLVDGALKVGERFGATEVFRFRSELLQHHLGITLG